MKFMVFFILLVSILFTVLAGAVEEFFDLNMDQDFDRQVLEDYGADRGWAEVWEAVLEQGAQSVQMAGDWLYVGTLLNTPLIRWVRIQLEVDREGYVPEAVELLYQTEIAAHPPAEMIEVGVNLFSLDPEALGKDRVDFVLEDDQGQRWDDSIVTAAGILEQTYSFGTAYDKYFHVMFHFSDREPDWASIEELTLTVVSTEDGKEYTVRWVLNPLL